MVGHLYLKGSKTSRFIMNCYFYKSLMTFKVLKSKKIKSPTSEKIRLFVVIFCDILGDFGLIFGAIFGRIIIKSYIFGRFFGIFWVILSVIFGQFINKITLSLNAPHNYNKFGLAKRPVLRMLSQYFLGILLGLFWGIFCDFWVIFGASLGQIINKILY